MLSWNWLLSVPNALNFPYLFIPQGVADIQNRLGTTSYRAKVTSSNLTSPLPLGLKLTYKKNDFRFFRHEMSDVFLYAGE